MRKKYQMPFSEVVKFDAEDIVVTSGLEDIGSGGGPDNNGNDDDSGEFDDIFGW